LNLRSEVRSVTSQFAVRHIAENIIQWRKRACSEGNQTIGRMGRFPPLGVLWLPRRFVARNINSMDTRLAHKIARTAFIPVDRFLLALIFLPPLVRGQAPPAKAGEGPKRKLVMCVALTNIIPWNCQLTDEGYKLECQNSISATFTSRDP
jgi:hypothetical protein